LPSFPVRSLAFLCASVLSAATANNLNEPITLTSNNGVLDILMIAKPAPIATIPGKPTGWVFQICPRPSDNSNMCPAAAGSPNYYGGTRLQLERGDLLKVRLVNELPLALDSDHASEAGEEFLTLNPINIHTHGMLVSPHDASATDPTYGDNIFVLTFNSANGKPVISPHLHATVRYDYTDYTIQIPKNHPSGLFWFHPHAHGLALNQISAGLAGIITVGHVSDYVCKNLLCSVLLPSVGVRHIILKDTQVLPGGMLQTQEDPDFSAPDGDSDDSRQGKAMGQDTTPDGGPNYENGNWFFTLNGQVYPSMPMTSMAGEIWRITNASGSATYNLNLFNPAQNRNMIMQVISADGVSISPSTATSLTQMAQMGGAKFKPEACPAAVGPLATSSQGGLCTRTLLLMPSSRVEVWVSYRNTRDQVASAPMGASAILRTAGYNTGPSGDTWPAVNLAQVHFLSPLQLNTPGLLDLGGEATSISKPAVIASQLLAANKAAATVPNCKALPAGHMRRVFYGVPTTDLDAFGLAYEEIDANGNVVGAPATDLIPFNPMNDSVCLPLGPGNTPVYERWQLVNVATEDHNFHIHQTKFRVLTHDELMGTINTSSPIGKGIEYDNIPLPHSNGTCGVNPPDDLSNPIADWRAGLCTATPITVEIPFAIAGRFVYHCHILEHEDGGMMAVIQVVPSGN
jgi:FtsP/CotA-like multicopper oxidase with cupredoxin domain